MGIKMKMANVKQKQAEEALALKQLQAQNGVLGWLRRQGTICYRCSTCSKPLPSLKKKRCKTKSENSLTECLGEEYTISR